ncbi:uncharacterized protein LOC133032499 [Cannabis sativa]|uniref:uncharacterized protein LOC133032499 n=1 Tax=Cannabis sativa TaxID=3483 RepID=UPI0029CA794E|nr:uncharacterized protein LOC133032499 [Cannabis sativa]
MGQFKLNVDASIDKHTNSIGIGAIIRNTTGGVVACLLKSLFGTFAAMEAEAVALMVALDWTLTIGLPISSFETDCLALISAFSRRASFCNEFGSILDDIASLLSNFPEASLIHVRRSANMAAHELAVRALRVDGELVWMDDFPPFLYDVLNSDYIQ